MSDLVRRIMYTVYGFCTGACMGSFLCAMLYRLPRGISLFRPSSCDGCGKRIPLYSNIPIISWLLLHARCHWCGASIPFYFFLWELTSALIGLSLAWFLYPILVEWAG